MLFFPNGKIRSLFITEYDNTISVTILLAESYFRNSGYGFQANFDLKSNVVINKSEGFNLHLKNKQDN